MGGVCSVRILLWSIHLLVLRWLITAFHDQHYRRRLRRSGCLWFWIGKWIRSNKLNIIYHRSFSLVLVIFSDKSRN
jgi:hypothetical protein